MWQPLCLQFTPGSIFAVAQISVALILLGQTLSTYILSISQDKTKRLGCNNLRYSAFYDGGVNSGQAGGFLYNTVKPALQAACPGKKIYITEYVRSYMLQWLYLELILKICRTGWPSRGSNNGNAVPSVPDEHNAISSINCAARDTSMTIFGFEYDDQMWKTSGAVEQSFGIFGKILPGDALNACWIVN